VIEKKKNERPGYNPKSGSPEQEVLVLGSSKFGLLTKGPRTQNSKVCAVGGLTSKAKRGKTKKQTKPWGGGGNKS